MKLGKKCEFGHHRGIWLELLIWVETVNFGQF